MRLDILLVETGRFGSRHRAQREIKEGRIEVNGKIIRKPAFIVGASDTIHPLEPFNPYVGVGGLKLAAALEAFHIDVRGKTVLDVGASTGGFTDCLLKRGAAKVIAVDVGTNQMVPELVADTRVTLYEQTHFLDTSATLFSAVEYLVMDVSFISAIPLIEHAKMYFHGPMIVLFKPQYESTDTPKSGVVRSKVQHVRRLEKFMQQLERIGVYLTQLISSPIKGGSGNIEFLCLITDVKGYIDVDTIVEQAHETWR